MPAAKPIAARRPPARAPVVKAELGDDVPVDDEPDPVDEGDCAVVPDPEGEDEEAGGVPSEEEALAVAWNVSNDLSAVGLIAKTMPASQWVDWRQ